jgi:hypothetical protein
MLSHLVKLGVKTKYFVERVLGWEREECETVKKRLYWRFFMPVLKISEIF